MTAEGLYIVSLTVVGALMGTVFDIYNTVTGAAKFFRWLRPLCDFMFWVASALAVYYVALQLDSGRLRIYTFVLLLAGYLVYRVLFHSTVVASAFRIIHFAESVFRAVGSVLEVLLWRPLRAILRILQKAVALLYSLGCKLEAGLFFVLRGIVHGIIWPWLTQIPGMERSFLYIGKVWKEFWDRTSNFVQARLIRP